MSRRTNQKVPEWLSWPEIPTKRHVPEGRIMGKSAGVQCSVCHAWFYGTDDQDAYNKCAAHEMAAHGNDTEDVDDD